MRRMNTPSKLPCPKCGTMTPIFREHEYRILYKCPNTKCKSRFTRLDRTQRVFEEIKIPSYFAWTHQDKAFRLTDALNIKYRQIGTYERRGIKFILTDSDIRGRAFHMERARLLGCRRFFIYPHSAPPSLIHAHYSTWEHTTAQFVVNEHHAEIIRQSGYKKPLESIGWYLTDIKTFRPAKLIRRVLFAPIHPKNAPIDREVNSQVFEKLHALSAQGAFSLTVRYAGALGENGLEKKTGVTYSPVELGKSNDELEKADIVIGHQTVAWKAVALGTPCVMMKEDMPRHYKHSRTDWREMNRFVWDKVSHLFRYPYDILADSCDTMGLLQQAAGSESGILDWKKRMIGKPFDADNFISIVESYL